MSRRRERQDADRNIHCVNHITDAALVMQAITQAQLSQASSPLDLSHPSGYQSLNAEPSYPAMLSKAAEKPGGQNEKNPHTKIFKRQKSLKENSPRRGEKNLEEVIIFPAISLTSF